MTEALTEGEDFYVDPDGRYVFTAAYLLKRGHCCENGCRHCPYGSAKDDATAGFEREADQ
ncbi:MAG: DUF5522 domain-containing protein [Phycisphaeraceae bacterium]